jgi:hypothetical protein
MKIACLIMIVSAAGLCGCASTMPDPLPPAARAVVLTPVSSAKVAVRDPYLRQREGRLELAGFVTKIFGSPTTEFTHLDVTFFDAGEKPLQVSTIKFSPQRLAHERHAPNRQATYRLPIDDLPPGTTRIEVRAHDAAEHLL